MKCNSMKDCYRQSCIFCEIVNRETETEILLRDEELCCFQDFNPGAEHHYLVVPNSHIVSCISLTKEHVPMVKEMVKMAKAVLLKHCFNNLDDIRLGFHIPPHNSVPHLHLHVLAPASQMDIRSLHMYGPQSFRFITAENLIQKLNNRIEPSALL